MSTAIRTVIRRVLEEVRADLLQVSLFGSAARGEARPDSDLDLLLVFRWLPEDREPYATQAETIAAEIAEASGIPVTVWSVSLPDLELGRRTPMLVDALRDSILLWCRDTPVPAVPFTRCDAVYCSRALLTRVEEGSDEFSFLVDEGRVPEAMRRARDDVVRLCTALLLLRGRTRPRRGDAARAVLRAVPTLSPGVRGVLRWAAGSYGPDGRDEHAPLRMPPGGPHRLADAIDALRRRVSRELRRGTSRAPEATR